MNCDHQWIKSWKIYQHFAQTFFVFFCQSDLSLSSPCHNQQSMSGSGCHLMKSPDLINLNLTWALHEVLSLYEKDMVKLMIILMKLSLKCKFGCGLYLKKSLITYLHLTFIHQSLFLWFWPQPCSHSWLTSKSHQWLSSHFCSLWNCRFDTKLLNNNKPQDWTVNLAGSCLVFWQVKLEYYCRYWKL